MYVRRVDTVEVIAVLLFIPVFLAFVSWDLPGGVAAGVVAAIAYAALRLPAIDAVGAGQFAGLLATRAIAYVAFGALGGWADRQLQQSLTKLEVYDQIDDVTKLYNARFFVQDTDLEMNRAQRYKTLFSVCVVDIPGRALEELSRRKRNAVLADLGHIIQEGVRNVDRAVYGFDDRHRFAVICPETGPEGARIFVDRMAERIATILNDRGIKSVAVGDLGRAAVTFPGDDDSLDRLRSEFASIDREEHPEHPAGQR